jgi:DNA-binding transcriptional LysR family regulator
MEMAIGRDGPCIFFLKSMWNPSARRDLQHGSAKRREPGVRLSDPCRGGRQALDFLAAIFLATSQKANGSAKGLRFSNYVQATQAALSGHGIMLGWRSITGDQVAKGLLVPASLPAYRPPDAYYAVLSSRSKNAETAGVVVNWLKHTAHTETL